MCKARRKIETELEITNNEVWQDKPNTAVKLSAKYKGGLYSSVGFSKVNWPDWWNREMGVTIAKGKAKAKIARGIQEEIRIERLIENIERAIQNVMTCRNRLVYSKRALVAIRELPEDQQEDFRQRLRAALNWKTCQLNNERAAFVTAFGPVMVDRIRLENGEQINE